eukprot:586818-Amphidinium_carterae.3
MDKATALRIASTPSCRGLREVEEYWRSDREVVLTAVQQNGHDLQYATEALRADREIVLAAVQQVGFALRHATEALKADRQVVLAAVQQNGYGYALQYATEALRADREIVLAALEQSEGALQFAADDLLEDPTFATEENGWFHLLKITMALSGRSTIVLAEGFFRGEEVLDTVKDKLNLGNVACELLHGTQTVPNEFRVSEFPGLQPTGEITEYQLLVKR